MYIVDDPMLALIARFVVDMEGVEVSDEGFLLKQVECLRQYVERFPPEEREQRALEWIETHSKAYRRDWQKKVVSEQMADRRCPDCPLVATDDLCHCEIHSRWLALLKGYTSGELTSRRYVEKALRLLHQNKDRLRITARGLRAHH